MIDMTVGDGEFEAWMKSLPREQSGAEVERVEHEHDVERGPYTSPSEFPHHYQESRH